MASGSPPRTPAKILVTRPAPDGDATAAILRARGFEPLVDPLLKIVFTPPEHLPDPADLQALLVSSANGPRALTSYIDGLASAQTWLRLPVLAVGAISAAAARDAGFGDVLSADGAVDDLAELAVNKLAPDAGPILHVAGAAVAGNLTGALSEHAFIVTRAIFYEARAVDRLGDLTRRALAADEIQTVTLFSRRSAETFCSRVMAAGLRPKLSSVDCAALSPAVAESAADCGFAAVRVAKEPTLEAMLSCLD